MSFYYFYHYQLKNTQKKSPIKNLEIIKKKKMTWGFYIKCYNHWKMLKAVKIDFWGQQKNIQSFKMLVLQSIISQTSTHFIVAATTVLCK